MLVLWVPLLPLYFMKRVLDGRSGVSRCAVARLAGTGLAWAHSQSVPGYACVRMKRKADSSVSTKPATTFADMAGVGPAKEELIAHCG
jgi:hypothetical protein